jgi:hypothetical protein
MKREYLIKVIEKHFFVMSKSEIAEFSGITDLSLSESMKSLLQTADYELFKKENLCLNNAGFQPIVKSLIDTIVSKRTDTDMLLYEKTFDECLFLISVYYHYPAVLSNLLIAGLIRAVLRHNILLA